MAIVGLFSFYFIMDFPNISIKSLILDKFLRALYNKLASLLVVVDLPVLLISMEKKDNPFRF